MEKIKRRDMTKFILSELINVGAGLAFGLVLSLVLLMFLDDSVAAWLAGLTGFGFFVLFTQNLYKTYFYYKLSMDVNAVCEGDGTENDSYLVAVILNVLTFGIYGIYWTYKIASRLRANAPRYGFKMVETGKEVAVLSTFSFGYISAWVLIKNMNKFAKVYNSHGLAENNMEVYE